NEEEEREAEGGREMKEREKGRTTALADRRESRRAVVRERDEVKERERGRDAAKKREEGTFVVAATTPSCYHRRSFLWRRRALSPSSRCPVAIASSLL
ncbi:hypothetical protein PIB30_070828, partial [Stylosanthes scabra]|nr:hypothetical protein [Stylosanthes scabra]